MWDFLEQWAGWIVAVFGGVTTAVFIVRWLYKRARRSFKKWDNAVDALVGREEIRHPDTGAILVPATPGLGERLMNIEQNLVVLSDTRTEMTALNGKVDRLTEAFERHLIDSDEHHNHLGQVLETIQTVAKTSPPPRNGS